MPAMPSSATTASSRATAPRRRMATTCATRSRTAWSACSAESRWLALRLQEPREVHERRRDPLGVVTRTDPGGHLTRDDLDQDAAVDGGKTPFHPHGATHGRIVG